MLNPLVDTTIDGTVATALLAILSSLVGALVWMVRATTMRSDKLLEARDQQLAETIKTLRLAVVSFTSFQKEASRMHGGIIERLEAIGSAQKRTLEQLQRHKQ